MVGVFLLVVRSSNMADLYARWTEPEASIQGGGSDQLGPFSGWQLVLMVVLTLQVGSMVAFY